MDKTSKHIEIGSRIKMQGQHRTRLSRREMAKNQRGKFVRIWKRLESFHSFTHINGNNARKILIREVSAFLNKSSSDAPVS
jgi:hypothetical protein